jgi:hypothetical protein
VIGPRRVGGVVLGLLGSGIEYPDREFQDSGIRVVIESTVWVQLEQVR